MSSEISSMQSNQKSKSLDKLSNTVYNSLVTIEESLCDLYNEGVENGTIGYSIADSADVSETLDAIVGALCDIVEELEVNPIPKQELEKLKDTTDFLEAIGVNYAVARYAERFNLIKQELK